jgi:hypothetical protein
MTEQAADTLYTRLGGYDAIAAVADDLLPRLMSDSQLGRFWTHRAEDSVRREKQLSPSRLSPTSRLETLAPGNR